MLDDSLRVDVTEWLSVAESHQIDVLCDEFEASWRRGESPKVEDYLRGGSDAVNAQLLRELLLVECELRAQQAPIEPQGHDCRLSESAELISKRDRTTVPGFGLHTLLTPASPVRGNNLDQFELLERIGYGAFGEVWKAFDTRLRRMVAIKLPRSDDLTAIERDRFIREGRAAAQLRHPNIVSVYEVSEEGERLFIVSEYVDGTNLRDWLRRQRPTVRQAAALVAQAAEALHYAHEQGVIHRDLKPANVIISSDDSPHITDFGLAKLTTASANMTAEGDVLGTPAYMSPEQARGAACDVDRRTDVYALGALLFELLTGQQPFKGDIASIMHQVVHDEPPSPRTLVKQIPRDLETICIKAMSKVPGRRYPSAQEMAVDLRRHLRGEPILARRVGIFEKLYRRIRRHPAIAAAVLLAVIAASALGMVGSLAQKNYDLQGLQEVSLSTDPIGARVAFIPLDRLTGELQLSGIVYAQNGNAVLPPGDYFVVAVLPDGRFHEVFRRVPMRSETLSGPFAHQRWRLSSKNVVELPKIEIPAHNVAENMAFVSGSEHFVVGKADVPGLRPHERRIRSFYADPTEFTVNQSKAIFRELPRRFMAQSHRGDFALSASFDDGVLLAESVGKRLPTEGEYEYMATNSGVTAYPWGDNVPEDLQVEEFGIAGTPSFDRLPTDPPVFGLASNVAEWTQSFGAPYPPNPAVTAIENDDRIVRGGDLNTIRGDPKVSVQSRDPRQRVGVARYTVQSGLGFRCVRSLHPIIRYEEFP